MAASGKDHFRKILLCPVYAKGGMVNISFSSHVGASSILLRVSGHDQRVFKMTRAASPWRQAREKCSGTHKLIQAAERRCRWRDCSALPKGMIC
jgi:hypothetical protein